MSEEGEVERACAFVDEVEQDRDQRNDDHNRCENGQAADEVVGCGAAGVVHPHGPSLKVHWSGLVIERLSGHVSAPGRERRV